MQAKLNSTLLEQFKTIYTIHRGVRLTTYASLVAMAGLLIWATSRIMPQSWHLLLQMLPILPRLWMEQGFISMLFLAVPLVQVFTWLVLWSVFVWVGATILRGWRRGRHKQQTTDPNHAPWQREPPLPSVDTEKLVIPTQIKFEAPIMAMAVSGQQLQEPQAWKINADTLPLSPPSQTIPQTLRQWSPSRLSPEYPSPSELSGPIAPVITAPLRQHQLQMHLGTGSDAGITRRQQPNEDSLVAIQGTRTYSSQIRPFGLFVVADGIGSYANGQEASQLAAQTMLETVFPRLISSNNLSDEALTDMIVQGLQQGNQAIYQRNSKGAASMGTTITAALVIDAKAYVVNVGDSRTYHYRPNRGLMQVTRDHSLVAMLVDTHMISPDDIYTHPDRHVIYRGLGEQAQVNVDSFILHLQSGDALLLCSDGLWEMVRNPAIEQIMTDSTLSPAQTSTSLINAALQGGGKDNISVIVVRLTD